MKNIRKTVSFLMIVILMSTQIVVTENYLSKGIKVFAAENGDNEISGADTTEGETIIDQNDESTSEEETESESGDETESGETSSEEQSTDETSTDETTTEEETTTEFIIIDEVYKVQNGQLIEYLGDKNDETITELVIPSEITSIANLVFANCPYIVKVSFEAGSQIRTLGEYVFYECAALETVELPEGITDLGYRTFAKNMNMKKLYIPSTVTSGRQILGKNCAITYVEFGNGMTRIPKSILRYAESVQEIKMYSGIVSIEEYAFEGCSKLTTITLANTIVSIKEASFKGCSSLSTLALPTTLISIGQEAFRGCTLISSLEIRSRVTSIGINAFADNPSLVLQVYANSYGKKYAIQYGLNWVFAPSEIERQQKSLTITETFESQISAADIDKYQLKYLKNYVPQGLCVIKSYVVVSMYHKNKSHKSILLVYKRSTGEFIKKVKLPSIDHVGAITNVEDRLVISLCNISATDYVAVINYKALKNAKAGKTVKYNYKIKLPGYADFASYDGEYFWAGRSANISNARMYGYKVKIKNKKLTFTKKHSFVVPANTQGMVSIKGEGGKREFILTQSYGRLPNSYIYTYKLNVNKASELGTPVSTKLAPSMIQGITKYKKYVYIVFESAAGLYCGDINNTSEIQMENVARIKYTNLANLYQETK